MSERVFDLLVIGTGPAAGTVAQKSAMEGKTVAMIESRDYGGTCALRGCNPKKVYTNAGNLVDQARRADGKLMTSAQPDIDWAKLLEFKKQFTQPVKEESEASFQEQGVETYHGVARFCGPDTIDVNGVEIRGERIFLGVGAKPRPLDIEGSEWVTLSDEFLDLAVVPPHVTFIGGGYISMEFAHVLARYGSRVVVIDHHERPLKHFDPDLVDQLVEWSEPLGIEFMPHARANGVTQTDTGLSVAIEQDGTRHSVATQLVVHGAGRVPNLSELNLEAGEVRFAEHGIEVDATLRSVSNPRVFAAGDCVNSAMPRLTPVANEEARIVVKNLFSDSPHETPNYGAVPSVVFTSPCLAAVGMSAREASENASDVEVRHQDTSTWGSVRKTAQPCAGYKLILEKQSGRIRGAHLLGPAAEETINLFALAMNFNLTARDLKSTLFAFPTFASDVRSML